MSGSAVFSEDGLYRYRLTREIAQPFEPATSVTFVMLNPSTADAETDDPTIRRCIGFAKSWGYSTLHVVNLYAFRATDPKLLRGHRDDRTDENYDHTAEAIGVSREVVAAWGANAAHGAMPVRDVMNLCRQLSKPLQCLGKTKTGAPRHPLYIRADTPLVEWP